MEEQTPTINWQELNEFLAVFRTADRRSNSSDMGHILKTCAYCGKPADEAPIITGRFDENLCMNCKRELVWQLSHCQNLADETTHNIEQLFSISWKRRIKIKKLTGEVSSSADYEDKSAIDKWLNKIVDAFEKQWDRKQKPGIFSNIAFERTKKDICHVKIRADTPAGTVVAELAHFIFSDYLKSSSLKWQEKEGLTLWCTVHYLAVMDYMRYAIFFDKTLTNLSGDGWNGEQLQEAVITSSALAGGEKYIELRNILNPCTTSITPLHWVIAQFALETPDE